MELPSKKLNEAIEALTELPGVGKRTALRYAFHLMRLHPDAISMFARRIEGLNDLQKCRICHNLCEGETCEICNNTARNRQLLCVVENVRDLYAIESTLQFKGIYHVLDGLISPMEGLGPSDINISSLISRIEGGGFNEVVLALSSTVEAETTNFYIYKKLKDHNLNITNLARGISFGDELEYADEISLGRSINNRTPYNAQNR